MWFHPCVLSLVVVVASAIHEYSSYEVWSLTQQDLSQVVQSKLQYQIWGSNSKSNTTDVMLPKNSKIMFSKGSSCMISDLDSAIAESMGKTDQLYKLKMLEQINSSPDLISARADTHLQALISWFFHEYRDLESINMWIKLISITFPDLVELETIGTTDNGNEMFALHVHSQNRSKNTNKRTIIITGGLHAREWVSISTVCYNLYALLNSDDNNYNFLEQLDFIFVPVFNPDGYKFSWENDRLWRKNRQTLPNTNCVGIDLDRSFDFEWENKNESPCSENYNGEYAGQATEVQIWEKYLNEVKKDYNIYGFIDFHSYSQEILYPYAYTCDKLPKDIENLLELSYDLSKAIRFESGKQYDVVQACKDRNSDILPGEGSGSILDYMYHHRARWAFQIKLRDTGNYGFLLPSKYIEPVGRESVALLKKFCDFLLSPDL